MDYTECKNAATSLGYQMSDLPQYQKKVWWSGNYPFACVYAIGSDAVILHNDMQNPDFANIYDCSSPYGSPCFCKKEEQSSSSNLIFNVY